MSLSTNAADRKATPIATGVLDYFPDAIAEIARVSKAGNDQHNPGAEKLIWDRSKSTDHADCIARHLLDRGTFDTDGQRHSAKVAWRALALLQIELDEAAGATEQFNFENEGPEFSYGPKFEGYEERTATAEPYRDEDRELYAEAALGNRSFQVPIVDVLRALAAIEELGEGNREDALHLANVVEGIVAKRSECVKHEPAYLAVADWPDSPGIWSWITNGDGRLSPYRYKVTEEKGKDSNDRYIVEILKGHNDECRGDFLVAPGSHPVVAFKKFIFGGDLGDTQWVKLEELPAEVPVVAEAVNVEADGIEPAAADDGVNYEHVNGEDGIVGWPDRPGIWGYFFAEEDRYIGRVTPERFEVNERAMHGGEFLVRKFGSGQFLRRRGSQESLAVAEFGPGCVGWKFIENLA